MHPRPVEPLRDECLGDLTVDDEWVRRFGIVVGAGLLITAAVMALLVIIH